MAEAQDVETLKRRGRRRLVGAVALVLAAIVVLPMVFDPEPPREAPPVSVRIPAENQTPFPPKVPSQPRAAQSQYVVQVGVFASPETVIGQLKNAGLPYYTEPMKDKLTRVRAGPFASRKAAEDALRKLKGLGLEPGAVTARPG